LRSLSEDLEHKDKVFFAKFDVDNAPDIAQELGISSMPTFMVFKEGEKEDQLIGANPHALKKLVSRYSDDE
jgi:thioredoxin 1